MKISILGTVVLVFTFYSSFAKTTLDSIPCEDSTTQEVSVQALTSYYLPETSIYSPNFSNGQYATLMLSGFGFNKTGGPLLFNHPSGISSDGQRLVMADRFNNRILAWNTLPSSNLDTPDFVLGQPDFYANNPGTTLKNLNWPGQISLTTDGKLIVADTYNNRVLVWSSFPDTSNTPASFEIPCNGSPWGVWSDGNKLAVAVTWKGEDPSLSVVQGTNIWHTFPANGNIAPNVVLNDGYTIAPRTITSDGEFFMVGVHEKPPGYEGGFNFVWKSWPDSNNQAYDFIINIPESPTWLTGDIYKVNNDSSILITSGGTKMYVWSELPNNANAMYITIEGIDASEGSDVTIAGNKVFASLYNGNKMVVFDSIYFDYGTFPDYTIGSPDICTNTLKTNFLISNPFPATDGERLYVISDIEKKLYVWEQLPAEDSVFPDWVYELPEAPQDIAVWGDTVAIIANNTELYVWTSPPINGNKPDIELKQQIGGLQFAYGNITIALDNENFYLVNELDGMFYMWKGLPDSSTLPFLTAGYMLNNYWGHLNSNGKYLSYTSPYGNHGIQVHAVSDLNNGNMTPLNLLASNPPMSNPFQAIIKNDKIYVTDLNESKVKIWHHADQLISGNLQMLEADIILGDTSGTDPKPPQIGINTFFYPRAIAVDSSNCIWVGETKFSNRLVKICPEMLSSEIFTNSSIESQVSLFPNPSDGSISIHLSQNIEFPLSLKIYAPTGAVVFSKVINDSKNNITLSPIPELKGIYYLSITTSGQLALNKPFLIN